jgi:hypothetical protein
VQNDFLVRWFYCLFTDLFRTLFKIDLKELGWGCGLDSSGFGWREWLDFVCKVMKLSVSLNAGNMLYGCDCWLLRNPVRK